MKIAVLSDIHGNEAALSVVLEAAAKEKVDRLFILGDIVGYYYRPDTVLKMLSSWKYDIVRGNHEDILTYILNGKLDKESVRKKYGSGHNQALERLSKDEIQMFAGLPAQQVVAVDGISFLLCHGSPWDNDYYLYPDAPPGILEKCDFPEHNFVLVGHSHYAFCYTGKNSVLINPGSVGQSRQMGAFASWAIVDTSNKTYQVRSTQYDTSTLKAEIRAIDPDNSYLLNILDRR